jgi:phage virion morphogenesis protein
MSNNLIALNLDLQTQDAIKALDTMRRRLLLGTELIEGIGAEAVKFSRNRIRNRTETAPDGSKWESLAASTLRHKNAIGKGHMGTLMEAPHLWGSIKMGDATEGSVSIGSALLYAKIHQEGGMAGRELKAKIPPRPYLGLSTEQKDTLQRWVLSWVKTLLEN